MKIELYVDRQLCDIGNPDKFSVTLKRQLYNPSELNTKDAQASYSITLPASSVNNRIFHFANVEEVKGKFERLYDAELIVNGIRIFEGKFKLSEIDSYSYKGNLGIPAPKTVKDIFGDRAMNKMGEWKLDLKNPETEEAFAGLDFISYYNNQPSSDCIFPFVLYGLLPKVKDKEGKYTDKELLDGSVRLGIEDFPPSVNCLKMLEKIFSNAGYTLTGSAFDDDNLANMYVSYRNPNSYAQEWNWGDLATIDIKGNWSMSEKVSMHNHRMFERRVDQNTDDYGEYFSVNMFDSNRLEIESISDTGTNVLYNETEDKYNDNKPYTRKNLHVVIPRSGYYKVRLECESFKLDPTAFKTHSSGFPYQISFSDKETDNKFTFAHQRTSNNTFGRSRYEIQVLRDYGEGDFHNTNVVGWFSKPQFPQTPFMENPSKDEAQFPKYYPVPGGPIVVDAGVNQNFVCGLHWGEHGQPESESDSREWNPMDRANRGGKQLMSYYMFIANGFSWNKTFSQKKKILSVYDSSYYDEEERKREKGNYHCYGIEDIEGEENNEETTEDKTPEWLRDKSKVRYAILDYKEHEADNQGSYPPSDYEYRNYATQTANASGNYVNMEGSGSVENIIWLEKGERIAVGIAADMGDMPRAGDQWLILIEQVKFALHIEPFRTDILWSNFDSKGNYDATQILDWMDEKTFRSQEIHLNEFLPSEQKIDDWVENFCKAFNLNFSHDEGNIYRLDIKQKSLLTDSKLFIDLNRRAHVVHRSNQSLGLPYKYDLGFSVNTDEEGYWKSIEEYTDTGEKILDKGNKGGGTFYTGSHETDEVSQTSNFSYCWYKDLKEKLGEEEHKLSVPVISDREVWANPADEDYTDMLKKQYFDKAQRFWFRSGTRLISIGNPPINSGTEPNAGDENPQKQIDAALVKNEYGESSKLILNYQDKPDTIMRHYFFMLDNSTDYTELECILTPDEYNSLGRALIQFNGDLYNAVSVDGYDPACRKPAKIKMIRKTR